MQSIAFKKTHIKIKLILSGKMCYCKIEYLKIININTTYLYESRLNSLN